MPQEDPQRRLDFQILDLFACLSALRDEPDMDNFAQFRDSVVDVEEAFLAYWTGRRESSSILVPRSLAEHLYRSLPPERGTDTENLRECLEMEDGSLVRIGIEFAEELEASAAKLLERPQAPAESQDFPGWAKDNESPLGEPEDPGYDEQAMQAAGYTVRSSPHPHRQGVPREHLPPLYGCGGP